MTTDAENQRATSALGTPAATAGATAPAQRKDAAEIQAEMQAIKEQQKRMQDMRIATILTELAGAIETFKADGTTYTIFLGTTGLTEIEQVELLKVLGEGELKINLVNTDEPTDWYETLYPGVWVGTFHNSRGEATLRTIEVARFPEIASAQDFDMDSSLAALTQKAAELNELAQG